MPNLTGPSFTYHKRTLEETVRRASEAFGVLMITGPRQTGKTTLLEYCADKTRNYVTLDTLEERWLAQNDPQLFLQKHSPPLIIDEIQYAPQLFSPIKVLCDQTRRPGLFWITGSQKFTLMKGVTESLAGRVAILDMLGLSQAEIFDHPHNADPFIPTPDWIEEAARYAPKQISMMDVYERIWKGSFPQIVFNEKTNRDLFYTSYVQTYIQRDVHAILNITSESNFSQFLRAVAARTGQLLNYANLARDADIDIRTAKNWLNVLEASGIIYLLRPYHNNVSSRLLKTPKLYFLDTGLCAFLTQWQSSKALEAGAMSGAILETYLFSEILKSYWHNGKAAYFSFYRDQDQREIDLIIEQDGTLYPIEFKKTATPRLDAIKHFKALEVLKKPIGHGGVICFTANDIPLSHEVTAIPVRYI